MVFPYFPFPDRITKSSQQTEMRVPRRQKQKKHARKNSCDQNNYQTLRLASKWNTCGSNYLKAPDERPLFLIYVFFFILMAPNSLSETVRICEDPKIPFQGLGAIMQMARLLTIVLGSRRSPGQAPHPAVRQQKDKRKVPTQHWRGGTTKHGNRQLSHLFSFFPHLHRISNCNM